MNDHDTGTAPTPPLLPRGKRRLDGLEWEVRAVAFRRLYETGTPVPVAELEVTLGADPMALAEAVESLERTGRLRRNDSGEIVTAGGISLEQTPHRIMTDRGARWTNCAYDALGIVAATGQGEVITTSPFSGVTIRIAFNGGKPEQSGAALFLADVSCCDSFIDEWCPNVNLFEDLPSAERWARERELAGTVVSVDEGTELAAGEWRPLVNASSGS